MKFELQYLSSIMRKTNIYIRDGNEQLTAIGLRSKPWISFKSPNKDLVS